MKTVVFASLKGGTGKSTLAAHLAVAAAGAGYDPIFLVDTDPFQCLTAWWKKRKAEAPFLANVGSQGLAATLQDIRIAGARLAIVDTPPAAPDIARSAIDLADLIVIPVRPSPLDLQGIPRMIDLVTSANRPFVFVVSHARLTSWLTVDAIVALLGHGEIALRVIGDRLDFVTSTNDGGTVQELYPEGRSASEVGEFWESVKTFLEQEDLRPLPPSVKVSKEEDPAAARSVSEPYKTVLTAELRSRPHRQIMPAA